MKSLFDTSVLIAAVIKSHPNHEASLACLRKATRGRNEGVVTTHGLAECYTGLTSLPMPHRVPPLVAKRMIVDGLSEQLEVSEISSEDYFTVIERVSDLGLRSGVIYDALHLQVAEKTLCGRLFTYNLKDFERLGPKLKVLTP